MPENYAKSYAESVGKGRQEQGEYRDGGTHTAGEMAKTAKAGPAHTPMMAQRVYLGVLL